MRPLMLHGHERAITQIKYNREGDLLFSCSKDPTPNVWYSINGERLGSFDGHNGTVWCIDVNCGTPPKLSPELQMLNVDFGILRLVHV
ncbi:eukaryotic translation initiation factor 3 subunit I [Trichonephila inaurata madagascariensis]|uniref:Serine-threonine kinase receptor-associated protein n=1 Tax=Trichonephila inaurata madagascariensis TaxID=2747483 RepID=A0A8X7CE96_9ARAC|nr:eukaryotic translation initiation factor 3 subunit I [Trichonephila inaurata madagascariensis]